MFAFVNKQRALVEVERRRGDIQTYTAPLDHAPEDMRDFLMDFYRNIIFKRELQQEQLAQHPNTVGKFHQQLVASKQLQSEDFWQRYYYRTASVERVQKELEAADAVKRQQRSEALQSALQSSMQTAQNIMAVASSTNKKDGDAIIFASREGDGELEDDAVVDEVTLATAKDDTDDNQDQDQQPQQQQHLPTSPAMGDVPHEPDAPDVPEEPSSVSTPKKDSQPLVTPRTEKKLLLVNDMAFATSAPLPTTAEEDQQNLSMEGKALTPTNSYDCDDLPMITPGTEKKLNVVNALSFAPPLSTTVKKENTRNATTPSAAMSDASSSIPSSRDEKALADVKRQQSLYFVHSSLMAILASIVGVIVAQKYDWTTMMDGLCAPVAPVFPYRSLTNTQELDGALAPWWVPSLGNDLALKQKAFEWVCDGGTGDRLLTQLSWTSAKVGFQLKITHRNASANDGGRKKKDKDIDLLTVKRLSAVQVFASQLELVSTKSAKNGEIVRAPWAKKRR